MVLKGLGQTLPDSLKYLDLELLINPDDLKIFLGHCKHIVRLNKLLVSNCYIKNIDITFNILKEFVREKRIQNFAYEIHDYLDLNKLEHQNLEKLVSEIQPFVNMKRYSDLVIRISDFDTM